MADVYVLDSFALISYLEKGKGAKKVKEILSQAEKGRNRVLLCIVNLGEVYYITYRRYGPDKAEQVLSAIEQLPVKVVDADRRITLRAARIKATYPMAYADAFALALANDMDAHLITGDPEFKKLKAKVSILWK